VFDPKKISEFPVVGAIVNHEIGNLVCLKGTDLIAAVKRLSGIDSSGSY